MGETLLPLFRRPDYQTSSNSSDVVREQNDDIPKDQPITRNGR